MEINHPACVGCLFQNTAGCEDCKRRKMWRWSEDDKPADQRKLTILFRNGHKIVWSPGEYTGYAYKGKIFVVTNGEQWVGVANMDTVEYITVM